MVISVKETTVFSVFHPDAQDLYNTCSDLKKVCWELWDPSRRLKAEVRTLDKTRCVAAQIAVVGQNSSAFSCICTYAV